MSPCHHASVQSGHLEILLSCHVVRYSNTICPLCHLLRTRFTIVSRCHLVVHRATCFSRNSPGDPSCHLVFHRGIWRSVVPPSAPLCNVVIYQVIMCFNVPPWYLMRNVPLSHWLKTSFSLCAIWHLVIANIIAMSPEDWAHRVISPPCLNKLDIFTSLVQYDHIRTRNTIQFTINNVLSGYNTTFLCSAHYVSIWVWHISFESFHEIL